MTEQLVLNIRMALAAVVFVALGWIGWAIYFDTFVAELPLYVGPELTPGASVPIPSQLGAACDVRYVTTACTHYASFKYQRSLTGAKEPEPVFIKMYRSIFSSKPAY